MNHWDRNAPLPETPHGRVIALGRSQEHRARPPITRFSPEMAEIARTFFDRNWIDAPVRPGKSPGAFAHPTVPSAHPYRAAQLPWASRVT